MLAESYRDPKLGPSIASGEAGTYSTLTQAHPCLEVTIIIIFGSVNHMPAII